MQVETILTPAVSFPPAVEVPANEDHADLEANDPESEYDAWLGERVAIEEYNSDRGVR